MGADTAGKNNTKNSDIMKLSFSYTPKFIPTIGLLNALGFAGMTILFFVFHTYDKNEDLPEQFKRHESIHSWQQVCLLLVSTAVTIGASFVLGVFGIPTPWWVWLCPAVLPLAIYVLAWIVEIVLPPYNRAYYDSCFEREAYANDADPDYRLSWFGWVRYFKTSRKVWE